MVVETVALVVFHSQVHLSLFCIYFDFAEVELSSDSFHSIDRIITHVCKLVYHENTEGVDSVRHARGGILNNVVASQCRTWSLVGVSKVDISR